MKRFLILFVVISLACAGVQFLGDYNPTPVGNMVWRFENKYNTIFFEFWKRVFFVVSNLIQENPLSLTLWSLLLVLLPWEMQETSDWLIPDKMRRIVVLPSSLLEFHCTSPCLVTTISQLRPMEEISWSILSILLVTLTFHLKLLFKKYLNHFLFRINIKYNFLLHLWLTFFLSLIGNFVSDSKKGWHSTLTMICDNVI